MMNNTIIAKTALLDSMIYNNRFANKTITAAQIGAEDLKTWTDLVNDLHKHAYAVYEAQENHVSDRADLNTSLFNSVKTIIAAIGDLSFTDAHGNEHKAPMVINDNFCKDLMELATKYAGRMGKDKAPELQLIESQISNTRKTLNQYENINGVNPDTIANLKAQLEELQAKKADLMNTADMCKDKPAIASPATFRKAFEHHLARAIEGQKAQSWEEYEAAKAARKAARKARHAAQKAEKAKVEAAA